MQKRVLAIAMALAMIAAMALPMGVSAAETGTVTCTVTGALVSVIVTDGSVAYGTLALNYEKDTTTSGVNDNQTATNNGTVDETFMIKSSDADGATPWTLETSQSANQFTHKFSTTGGAPWTAMDTVGGDTSS